MVILGLSFRAAMASTMNSTLNYLGIAGYPKILGTARMFWAFVGGAGVPLAGYVRDTVDSFLPALLLAIAVVIIALISLIYATPPLHPSLKEKSAQAQPA